MDKMQREQQERDLMEKLDDEIKIGEEEVKEINFASLFNQTSEDDEELNPIYYKELIDERKSEGPGPHVHYQYDSELFEYLPTEASHQLYRYIKRDKALVIEEERRIRNLAAVNAVVDNCLGICTREYWDVQGYTRKQLRCFDKCVQHMILYKYMMYKQIGQPLTPHKERNWIMLGIQLDEDEHMIKQGDPDDESHWNFQQPLEEVKKALSNKRTREEINEDLLPEERHRIDRKWYWFGGIFGMFKRIIFGGPSKEHEYINKDFNLDKDINPNPERPLLGERKNVTKEEREKMKENNN